MTPHRPRPVRPPILGVLGLFACLALAPRADAAIGLTTVPTRDQVRLTIYNGVDLTLVQEYRTLVLKKGMNRIQYQWANTLIDSTSLELRPLSYTDKVEVADIVYPRGAPSTLVWEVQSSIEGPVRFEISGFTSGLTWNADYVLRATPDETKADVEGFVNVVNGSGEDYTGAEVRLVVGSVHLVETIRDLATNQVYRRTKPVAREELKKDRAAMRSAPRPTAAMSADAAMELDDAMYERLQAPVVESRRLGDYHLFDISGTHALANGATTRLRAISTKEPMPLEVLYRVPFRVDAATKHYRFINDAAHQLPAGPLPEGAWHVFRTIDAKGQLSFSGRTSQAYVPPDQKVELALGVDPAIAVRQKHAWHRETHHYANNQGQLIGWFTHDAHRFKLVNTKQIAVSVEFLVSTAGGEWKVTNLDGERRDQSTFRVQSKVAPGGTLELGPFVVTARVGQLDGKRELPDPPAAPKQPSVATKP